MRFAARMQKLKKVWAITSPNKEKSQELSAALNISDILAQVLINRNITAIESAQQFLNPKLSDMIDPSLMPGIEKGVERVNQALANKEKITIYGDYDVDGITSTSILWHLFEMLGADVDYYIPHRIEEGYGLNPTSIKELAGSGTNLIITVDCGVTAIEEVALAKELGVDVVITDHHQMKAKLPDAAAIVHPLLDESYLGPYSAGAMVAFKLAWAVSNQYKRDKKLYPKLREFLLNATNFAAMGTIADVVSLVGENRSLTHYGLRAMPSSELPGIRALLSASGLEGKNLDSQSIAFGIAPMLNAAGRMGHARLAVELLTSDNDLKSIRIVEYLKQQNTKRRSTERKILKQANELITTHKLDHPDQKSIVLANENWHQGVVGIVASRVIDKYYRPTILFNTSNGTSVGSARSIEGFNILKAIEACAEHLIGFGGHAMAAGLQIETRKVADFSLAFEEYTRKNLCEKAAVSNLQIDGEYPIGQFDLKLVDQLDRLGPFGKANPKPVFATRGVRLVGRPKTVGAKGEHLQMTIKDSTASVRCIGFRMGNLEKKVQEADYFSVAYEPQVNTYNGASNVQFVLTDINFD